MSNKFHKAIHDIHGIRMTAEEKRAIHERVLNAPAKSASPLTAGRHAQSPYVFMSWFSGHRLMSVTAASLAVVILASGGLAYAAKGSLPGDVLYPIKVNVVEPIQVSLAGSATGRARVQSDLATLRLNEAEKLAAQGKLDMVKQAEITNLLSKQTSDLTQSLVEVKKASPIAADDITIGFQASMDAHARVLDTLASAALSALPTGPASASGSVPAAVSTGPSHGAHALVRPKVQVVASSTESVIADAARKSAVKVEVADYETDTEDQGGNVSVSVVTPTATPTATPASAPVVTEAPASSVTPKSSRGRRSRPAVFVQGTTSSATSTPAASATSSGPAATRVDVGTNDNANLQLSEKKQVIRELIMQASTTIQNVGTDTNSAEQSIIDQTRSTIEEANQSLDQAEQEQSNGNNENAYSALLQSEKSAREANIFINAGLQLHGKHGGDPHGE